MALDENALVTWEKTQSLLGLDASDQGKYESLINAASAIANKYTLRNLKARDYTHVLDGSGNKDLLLPQYPINSITSVHVDIDRDFNDETEITEYLHYDEEGILYYEEEFPDIRQTVKVVYNAGFPAASIPEDIQMAVVEIVVWLAGRLNDSGVGIGIRQIEGPGGGTTEYEMTIPLAAQRKLEPYVRREGGI